MKTTFPRLITALCAAGLLSGAAALRADDVTDQVDEAMKAYKDKDYATAASGLEAAAQLIRQKRGEGLTKLLPNALDGWTAEDATSSAAGAALFGGGTSAARRYTKGDASIKIELMTDSPMLQGVMMMINNPMFATSDGGKMERIKGQKALVKQKDLSIQIVVGGAMLLTIDGDDCDMADVRKYAEAIDYAALAGAL
jgi:hypothetical protein